MRRSGNKEENKRIIMDLDVVLKCHDYPYIVQCIGTFITPVSSMSYPNPVYYPRLVYNTMSVFKPIPHITQVLCISQVL